MHCLCVMILLQSQYKTQEWDEEKKWWRKAIKLPFPVNKQNSTAHTPFFYVLNSFFPPLLSLPFSSDECQMHTDDDNINVHKILPTVSSKQWKNSEFGFAHMICVPYDVSLSLPYMSLNKYCLNEKVNSCGCTVLGCCCIFFSLLSFNPNSSALTVCAGCVCADESVLLQIKRFIFVTSDILHYLYSTHVLVTNANTCT